MVLLAHQEVFQLGFVEFGGDAFALLLELQVKLIVFLTKVTVTRNMDNLGLPRYHGGQTFPIDGRFNDFKIFTSLS